MAQWGLMKLYASAKGGLNKKHQFPSVETLYNFETVVYFLKQIHLRVPVHDPSTTQLLQKSCTYYVPGVGAVENGRR